jgi:hypothetical protein
MGIVFLKLVPFKHSLSCAELKAAHVRIKKAQTVANALAQQLHTAIKTGNPLTQKCVVADLLTSEEAVLACAIQANWKLPKFKRHPLEDCLSLPDKLDLSKPLSEPVRVWPQPKSSGGYRMIQDHGLRHRTAQHLIKRVLDAHLVPRPFQYTHLGCHQAIKETKALIKQGYVYTAHLDIQNFFRSFELEKLLPELPLPKEVVANAVVGRHMAVQWDPESMKGKSYSPSLPPAYSLLEEARLGIPQGSACSPVVGAYCLSRLQWTPIADVALLNVADDFLLLSKNAGALEKAIGEVAEAVGNLPGGTFTLKLKKARTAKQGFKFLGHE